MKTTVEPMVYSQQDAAKALKCNVDAVREKLLRGEIPAYKDGSYWKIPITLLQAYIENEAIREAKERREVYEKRPDKTGNRLE